VEFGMTEIYRGIIPPPFAWKAAEVGSKEGLVREFGRDSLDALVSRLSGREIPSITRADASDPAIASLMAQVREDIMDGRGVSIARGPDPARYDPDDYARLYWALGTHLGQGVVQSAFNDHVARVERNPNLPWRGTTTDMELRPHTDFHELMSLASVSLPESGGASGFVSSLAVHNEIFRTRPDLLGPLYAGWYHVSPLHKDSPTRVPVFCCVDGKVSCFSNPVFFTKPGEAPEPFPEALTEALAYMGEITMREDFILRFVLEPGEIAFWHNFQVMHSRTAFRDTDERRRLLLRLWLHVPEGGRPMAEEIKARARIMDRDHIERSRAAAR
jgi:hypothetical protein